MSDNKHLGEYKYEIAPSAKNGAKEDVINLNILGLLKITAITTWIQTNKHTENLKPVESCTSKEILK